jgi:serine O-acetyltransferase
MFKIMFLKKFIAVIIPDINAVEDTIDIIFKMLFPIGDDLKTDDTIEPDESLRKKFETILDCLTNKKEEVTEEFLRQLPAVKKKLLKDGEFLLNSDPAATSLIEVISIYPGFFATFCYRTGHSIHKMGIPLLPRMITEYAHKKTGIDIHPGATIGCPFAIDHGTGIVIGETAIIGNKVKMYQGVTLGALSVAKNKASKKRHPTIEDNVILYAGCTILGGETIVGRNCIIGGNVWLTESIAPFSIAYHKSEIEVRDQKKYKEPVNFII